MLPMLVLKKNADRRLKAGHLWIYSNEVDSDKSTLKQVQAGQQVQVCAANGKVMGVAFYNPATLICARLISRDGDTEMSRSLIVHRLKIALSLREQVFSDDSYRLVYGDSDGLPGLVVDRFGDTVVIQISSVGMEGFKDDVVAALQKVLNPARIIIKNDGKMREVEGLPQYVDVVLGDSAEQAHLVENGVQFVVPVEQGQKTGWFYDHRMSRARLAHYVKGKRVLDLFSYVGGWGVQAAAFGAEQVVCVDSSALALDYVGENARLNNVSERMATIHSDAFDACKGLLAEKEKFDVVIVDPPAFIPRRRDIKSGELAYQRLNQLALRLLNKDGLLVSASCSMHLSRDRLIDIVRAAGRQTDRFVQLVEQGHQGADHPIIPAIPETEYLKAQFYRVLPSF